MWSELGAPSRLVALLVIVALWACGSAPGDGRPDAGAPGLELLHLPVDLDPAARPPERLSETHLIAWDGQQLRHRDDAFPYDLNTQLFSDYALKQRALWLPPGSVASYRADGVLDFPVGTVALKSFLFPADLREPDRDLRLVETRLLMRSAQGWQAWPYIWRSDGSDADLRVAGEVQTVDFIGFDGEARTAHYLVPQRNQCVECHEIKDAAGERMGTLVGPTARNLNRRYDYPEGSINQLQRMVDLKLLEDLPDLSQIDEAFDFRRLLEEGVSELETEEVERAARDYLDVNCAHCHNPQAVEGQSSQLFLNHDNVDLFRLGICKPPGSAGKGTGGHRYDIVPGDPDTSILVYRMETEDLGSMMPGLGRSLNHVEAIKVVRAWIAQMALEPCLP